MALLNMYMYTDAYNDRTNAVPTPHPPPPRQPGHHMRKAEPIKVLRRHKKCARPARQHGPRLGPRAHKD